MALDEKGRRVRFAGTTIEIWPWEPKSQTVPFQLQKNGSFSLVAKRVGEGRSVWDVDEVWGRLFVGAMDAAQDEEVIKRLKITHVVVALGPDCPGGVQFEGVHYLRLFLDDTPETNIQASFARCLRFIRKAMSDAKSNVLVHCFMGISRSVSLACAYLMKQNGWSSSFALEHIRKSRFEARPNPGFIEQLQDYEWLLSLEPIITPHRKRRDIQKSILNSFQPSYRHALRKPVRIVLAYLLHQ